jgi:hypothetical protein
MIIIIKGIEVKFSGGIIGLSAQHCHDDFYGLVCTLLRGWRDAGYANHIPIQEYIDKLGLRDP